MENGIVLQTVNGLGGTPAAVAVDPASNEAVIVNQTSGTVSILSLGPALSSPQIIEASPASTLGGSGAANLILTITGGDFVPGGSTVLLDGSALPTANVNVVSARRIIATVPGGMLTSSRRYLLQVLNPGALVSNLTDLSVIQAVTVGTSPVGVAVDTDRDLAVVTNNIDGTASLVSLAPMSATYSPESLGPVGIVGIPINVGAGPEGVAVLSRSGLAVVANNGSNDVSVINETTGVPTPVALCGSNCTDPVGVAMNQDTSIAAVTSTNGAAAFSTGSLSLVSVGVASALTTSITVDQDPVAVAFDPTLDFAAVATASGTSSVDIIDTLTSAISGRVGGTGLQNPSGIVLDPLNNVFLVANSLLNNIAIIDPTTLIQTPIRVGIAPTSIDFNFQTSTLVTVNSASHTMSVLDYVCPPSITAPACSTPRVRAVLGVGGAQSSTLILGPNAVAIDPKLNLAVLVDPDNSRVLLLPLPY
jgi:DNA-binding beta-propeller fold protein YncE